MPFLCHRWGTTEIYWNLADWKWSECQLVSYMVSGFRGNARPNMPDWLREDTKDEEKRNQFIRLLCKIRGYPRYDEKKEVKPDIIVTARDVEMVVKAVAGIDVTITEE